MTDRHLHCVYFKYDNINSTKGYCLLHQKEIEDGFRPHCPNIVLRPNLLLSYYLVHEGLCDNWECGDKKALEYLRRLKFNDYPKGDLNDVKLLNEFQNENEQLKKENKHLRCTIESNSQDDYIDYLEKQNERLKERITELASNDKIVFIGGSD